MTRDTEFRSGGSENQDLARARTRRSISRMPHAHELITPWASLITFGQHSPPLPTNRAVAIIL